MIHTMKLSDIPFAMIADGRKTIESRLFDDKRQKVQLGDELIFRHLDDSSRTAHTGVVGLLRYADFNDMLSRNDPRKFDGRDADELTR
jgi:ASC-1-like (ASCH) protein